MSCYVWTALILYCKDGIKAIHHRRREPHFQIPVYSCLQQYPWEGFTEGYSYCSSTADKDATASLPLFRAMPLDARELVRRCYLRGGKRLALIVDLAIVGNADRLDAVPIYFAVALRSRLFSSLPKEAQRET